MEDSLADPGSAWGPLWIYGLAVILSGLASMFFAYFYFLLSNFSRAKILQLANGSGMREKLEAYLDRYDRILNAVVALEITFKTLFLLSLYIYIAGIFETAGVQALIPTFIMGAVWFTLFCRILPAEVGTRREEEVLLRTFPFLYWISILLTPVLFPLRLFRSLIRRMMRPATPDEEAEHFAEEILDAVEEGEREGAIREDEAEMIESIVELPNLEVSEIMTPRIDMVSVESTLPVEEAVKMAVELGHSRIPVYEENRDQIMGVLYVKDLLKFWPGRENIPMLAELVRKPYFIPETKKVSKLFTEFRENKLHIAIVLDEYGGTAGLVTNEDILEEIVGEIVDEYDAEEEEELKIIDARRAEASGKLHIDELNEKMEIDLPESEDFDTIGGYIFTRLGKVPALGDEVRHENVCLKVLDADERRINRIAIEIDEEKPDA